MGYSPVIGIDEKKCVNCHSCISACPVKYCIDGSGDKVAIDHTRCIGCGSCIEACTHEARYWVDDWDSFIAACERHEKLIAIVAPSAAASFPGAIENLNGFLASLGVSAFFDVSFGAELTIKSYLDHVMKNKPATVIAQPCPAVVNYIELYRPELIPYLAPADSPMLHTIKMIKEYYPEYAGYRIAVISPCIAKKQEFEAVGLGDFNVTFNAISRYLLSHSKSLSQYSPVSFTSPPAERAVAFSTPGGLLGTLRREAPEIADRVRKIEGSHELYPYLDTLGTAIRRGVQPPLIDCLNCSKGCNGGTGTGLQHESQDILESAISRRVRESMEKLGTTPSDRVGRKKLARIMKRYWKPGLYVRSYRDRSQNARINIPTDAEKWAIYRKMNKESEADIFNCASCGYASCEGMSIAIFNGLNKPENCHHYTVSIMEKARLQGSETSSRLHGKINESSELMATAEDRISFLSKGTNEQVASLEESYAAIEQMIATIRKTSVISGERQKSVDSVISRTTQETDYLRQSIGSILDLEKSIRTISEMISVIDKVAADTNLLAMNAAIEAAHAGESGKGFSVVAGEIKRLAETSGESSKRISGTLKEMIRKISTTTDRSQETAGKLASMIEEIRGIAEAFSEFSMSMAEMSAGTSQITETLKKAHDNSLSVREFCSDMTSTVNSMSGIMEEVVAISRKNVSVLTGTE